MRRQTAATIAVLLLVSPVVMGQESGCAETVEQEEQIEENPAAWSQVTVGMAMQDVRRVMGEPSNVQEFDSEFGHTECWYYGISYQICFGTDQRVESKNKY